MEKEKGALEGAKSEAEHYLSMQRDMALKQHSLYSRYMYVVHPNDVIMMSST